MKVSAQADATEIVMEGPITEFSALRTADVPAGKPVILDTGGVTSINSLGVRTWLVFMDSLTRRASQVTIRRLATVLVAQTVAIRGFLGRAQIESFMVPWLCGSCSRTLELLHRSGEEIRPHPCPKCGKSMILDDLPEWYAALAPVSARS
jgi:hypothetical protein